MNELDQKARALLLAWPVLLFGVSLVFQVGSASEEMKVLDESHKEIKPLLTRVAVLESEVPHIRDDLSEIKADLAVIRKYLIEKSK
jgi:predicted nuclease with TOPRIM domain